MPESIAKDRVHQRLSGQCWLVIGTEESEPIEGRLVGRHPPRNFVLPIDAIPDLLLGLGYTDDAAVVLAAFTAARTHIAEAHRARAREWLFKAQATPQG
jgi:hypothetical protein